MKTGFLYDERFLDHDPGYGHPECPERISRTMDHLRATDFFASLVPVSPQAAEEEWIRALHSGEYVKRAREACRRGLPELDCPDVGISPSSYETALLAVGGALALADEVMQGRIRNGFALLRPPGHHAEASRAMGFCLFNNIAVLARYLQKKYGLEKILILDWDVHHGNGTQHAFEEDPSVYYMSLHQYPLYPGTGDACETGRGRGDGATLNCPMGQGAADRDYEQAFREKILPETERFRPDAILISAGFDAHRADPLAGINLSTEFFGWMTERMLEAAETHSGGRLISLLEGGYNLDYLPLCVEQHLRSLGRCPAGTKS